MGRPELRVEIPYRPEDAADWVERATEIHGTASEDGSVRPDVPLKMIAEHVGMAPLVEFKLARCGLKLEPRKTDQKTGQIIYRFAMVRPSQGVKNGTR